MDEEKVIRDRETGEELSLIEIRIEYVILKALGETEAETFEVLNLLRYLKLASEIFPRNQILQGRKDVAVGGQIIKAVLYIEKSVHHFCLLCCSEVTIIYPTRGPLSRLIPEICGN